MTFSCFISVTYLRCLAISLSALLSYGGSQREALSPTPWHRTAKVECPLWSPACLGVEGLGEGKSQHIEMHRGQQRLKPGSQVLCINSISFPLLCPASLDILMSLLLTLSSREQGKGPDCTWKPQRLRATDLTLSCVVSSGFVHSKWTASNNTLF